MTRFLILFLLTVSPVAAQVLEVNAGASALTNTDGATATLYTPSSTFSASLGYGDGHLLIGASDTFGFHDWIATVGDKQYGISFDGIGLGISTLGVSLSKQSDQSTVSFFTGLTGQGTIAPFLIATRPQHVGTGIFASRRFRHVKLFTLDVINGGSYTAAQGAELDYLRKIRLDASGGILNGQPYFNGQFTYRPVNAFSFYASHQSYFLPSRATGDSVGFGFASGRFTAQGSVNESDYQGRTTTGESIGGGLRIGPVAEQSTMYRTGNRTVVAHVLTETSHHLTSVQTVSQSKEGTSVSVGGAYVSNRLSVSLTHSIVFLLNGEGFAQVSGVTVSLRIHDTTFNASTVETPLGKSLWSAAATDYVQIGTAVPGQTVHFASGGRFLITGKVVDAAGEPVAGAAVQVLNIIAYSNSQGLFEVRRKRQTPVPIAVLPAVFSATGSWAVVSAPNLATPGTPLLITVKRLN